jgi:hypothetical protein
MISYVFGSDAARDCKLAKDMDPSRFSNPAFGLVLIGAD